MLGRAGGAFLLLVWLDGCGGVAERELCGPDGTCAGAESCYATCFCEDGDEPSCRERCGLIGEDPLTLAVTAPDADTTALEQRLLEAVNAARETGGACGGASTLSPALPLAAQPELGLAARRHAFDLVERGYFGHATPEGYRAIDRARAAGFRGCAVGENLATGDLDPDSVVAAWLESEEHCAILRDAAFSTAGIALDRHGATFCWVLVAGD